MALTLSLLLQTMIGLVWNLVRVPANRNYAVPVMSRGMLVVLLGIAHDISDTLVTATKANSCIGETRQQQHMVATSVRLAGKSYTIVEDLI